jgi:AmmeMemoRadiSam system protein A
MSPLSSSERLTLLEVARQAVMLAVQERRVFEPYAQTGTLGCPAGAFVTLRQGKRLRGCIGQIEPREPLVNVVARCAMSAAIADPRFEALRASDLESLDIEISVVSTLEAITPAAVVIGKHGLLITRGPQRGVLLPQVAEEYSWTVERFLEETCAKAGLHHEAWRDAGTRINAFTAEIFSTREFDQPVEPAPQTSD